MDRSKMRQSSNIWNGTGKSEFRADQIQAMLATVQFRCNVSAQFGLSPDGEADIR